MSEQQEQQPIPPEAVDAPEDHQPGIAELSVISVLNNEWPTLSVEQRGPDGSEVIGMVLFHACPLCNAVVPLPNEKTGHHFPRVHAMHHVRQARDFDVLNEILGSLRSSDEEAS